MNELHLQIKWRYSDMCYTIVTEFKSQKTGIWFNMNTGYTFHKMRLQRGREYNYFLNRDPRFVIRLNKQFGEYF